MKDDTKKSGSVRARGVELNPGLGGRKAPRSTAGHDALKSPQFVSDCERAGITSTLRQANKWLRKIGAAVQGGCDHMTNKQPYEHVKRDGKHLGAQMDRASRTMTGRKHPIHQWRLWNLPR